ncbi:class I SAM-dependent methyltransferase [Limnohabitans sp. T6-20]|uniref:class I SAM-dependent methyltransferase n=1 Tax=Limnohabitans sp. T6-20 TaxID=1100725 RepID=UPI000D391780|nr:class I SAM-dependent methyltransferase [Limnohabitans sp. T6-20]PUE10199.1 hypothetical protein B9Z33_08850 [Limnohabitans sp. T6-20]
MINLSFEEIHKAKTGKVSDKWESYLRHYDSLFAMYRDQEVSLLEIGIQNGGSLDTYLEYFKNAKILIGCDINTNCNKLNYQNNKIKIVVGDANLDSTYKEIRQLESVFNIVIDDGSHVSMDIINSFIRYFPLVSPGGVYVIEDTHTLYSRNFGGGLLNEFSAYNFFKKLIDIVNFQWWRDHFKMEDYLTTFFLQGIPDFIHQGWIESIEFKNSVITVKKSNQAGHDKLGPRIIRGTEALVVDLPR